MSSTPAERPTTAAPGNWTTARNKLLIALASALVLAFLNPFAGIAAALIGAIVLKGRSRLVLIALAVLLVGYLAVFTTTVSLGRTGSSSGSTQSSP